MCFGEISQSIAAVGILLAFASPAAAELENVSVGGKLVLFGEYYKNVAPPAGVLRWPSEWLVGRPVGNGPDIFYGFGGNKQAQGVALVSQWTRLNVNAEFTERVRAFVELDNVDEWGSDFRSDYLTGSDSRSGGAGDTEVYQAYVEVEEIFGAPFRIRIGRQELRLGSEWLVGANDNGPAPSWGLSFDALRLTWVSDAFSIDAWSAKLADGSPSEEDGDVDFYGVYGSYLGVENFTFDAYWLWLRDAGALQDTAFGAFGEWIEERIGVDDYGTTNLHTVGLRIAGKVDAFDFEIEAARQFGEAGQAGALFRPVLYGDGNAKYGAWGCNLELGLSLDAAWQPHVCFGYAFLGGEDRRDIAFGQWLEALVNPFYTPAASVSFNRLFSNWSYSAILDGTDMSNVHAFHLRAEATPAENIELGVDLGYYRTDEVFKRPVSPLLGFRSRSNDAELGWELDANVTYRFSGDLYFRAGWDHLFVGDGLKEGSYTQSNGFDFNGWINDDAADYWYFETGIEF